MAGLSSRWVLLRGVRPLFTAAPVLIVQRPQRWLSLVVAHPQHSRRAQSSDVEAGMAHSSEVDKTAVQSEPSSPPQVDDADGGGDAENAEAGPLIYKPYLVLAEKHFDPVHGLTAEEGTLGASLVEQQPSRLALQLRELFDHAPRPPNAHYILSVLHFLQRNGRFDQRYVYPAAKLMALLLTDRQSTATLNGDTSLRAVWDEMHKFLEGESAKLAIPTVRCSTLLYLRVCADPTLLERVDNWPVEIPSFAWKDVLEASHCFRLLASIALVQAPTPQARTKWLRGVCTADLVLVPRESFYTPEPPFSIWPNFLDALTGDATGDELMSIFFDQMASLEIFEPTLPDFREFLSPALRKHARWRVLPSRQTAEGKCTVCSHPLEKRPTLTPAEFEKLREEFSNILVKASRFGSNATVTDYDAFLRFMERLKQGVRPDRRAAVIDGLNVLYQSWTNLEAFHQSLFTLAEDGYSPILLSIRRPRSREEKEMVGRLVETARSVNAQFFFVDKRSLDDYFLINAALMLGPQAEVLSNDEFADHGDSMADPASRRLLDIWSRSNIIRLTHDRKCLYPSMFYKAVQKSPIGYHLSVQPRDKYGYKFIHLPFSYCIQTATTGSAADGWEARGPPPTRAKTS